MIADVSKFSYTKHIQIDKRFKKKYKGKTIKKIKEKSKTNAINYKLYFGRTTKYLSSLDYCL